MNDEPKLENMVPFPGIEKPLAVIETQGELLQPWDVAAESLAAEAYRIAHGMTPTEDLGGDAHRARMGQIQRLLAKELQTGMTAVLAWAGLSLYLQRVREALQHVVLAAEIHPPSRGRHNERVLVYADRLTVLGDLMQECPKGYTEAVAWWKEREERLLQLEELPRIVALVTREMGGAPEKAKEHSDVEKIEGMLFGLLGVVHEQKAIIERQTTALKQRMRR